ncbi:MAG TPA: MFS transporter, partial [Stellaceae bacterium]|nr:MFS transporter [Stellaceae bacterium]
MRRSSVVVVTLLCAMYFVAYVDRVNISMAAGVFGPELKLSNTEVGFAISAFGWTYLIFQILGAWLGDQWGARRTLTVCGIIVGVATISIGLAGGLGAIVAARILLGLGEGALFPVATRALSQWVSLERRGWAQGATHAAARLGNALTPPIIAVLITLSSWRGSFFVVGVFMIAWAAIWFGYFRDRDSNTQAATAHAARNLPWS